MIIDFRSTVRSISAITPLLGLTFLLGFFIEYSLRIIGYIFVTVNGILVCNKINFLSLNFDVLGGWLSILFSVIQKRI